MGSQSSSDKKDGEIPALTIVFQSWATPIVGLAMLVLGLVAGYTARPLIAQQGSSALTATPTTKAEAIANTPQPTVTAATQPSQDELMDYLISQTRHFRGNPDAPITIIEFSDYQ